MLQENGGAGSATEQGDRWSAELATKALTATAFVAAAIAIVLLVNRHDRRLVVTDAEHRAVLLLDRTAAVHNYLTDVLFPAVPRPADPDAYDPVRMSSNYALAEMDRAFNAGTAEPVHYKRAAVNARDPRNEADALERPLFETSRRVEPPERGEVRQLGGKPWLVLMRRGPVMQRSCLRCHGDPADAPRELLARYGRERGFGKREGELAAVTSIRIPLEQQFAAANAFSLRLSMALLALLGLVFAFAGRVHDLLLFRPLLRIREYAAAVAAGSTPATEPMVPPHGRDLRQLAGAVNAMAARLARDKQELFEHNPAPMWVFDEETLRVLEVNQAAIDHYGYARDEFLAMTVTELRPPEDVPAFLASRARAGRAPVRPGVFRHRRKGGEVIEAEVASHPIRYRGRPARVVIATDVTERRRTERALRESEEQLRIVTDGLPAMIAYVDAGERYRFVNGGYERWFGCERTAIVGRTLREVLGPEAYDKVSAHVERALRGEGGSFELSIARGIRSSITYVPHRGDGGDVRGFVSIVSDVTERLALQERVQQSQKMDAVGQLAGGIAHDFNNILSVITSLSHLLLEDQALSAVAREDVTEIGRAASRAADLTRKLLAFSRKQTVQPAVLGIDGVVADGEKMLRRLVREDIRIRLALGTGDAGTVLADAAQLEVALVNLVVNAQDALPSGGTIVVETALIEVDGERARSCPGLSPGPHVLLRVSDTGEGMPPEVLARAFEPFFTTKEVGKGTGLGLATVYGIVQQAGGSVQLESAPGQGTAASIYLPRVEPPPAASAPGPRASPGRGGEAVLLVEDEEGVRKAAQRALQARGYQVTCARDGLDGLATLGAMARCDLLVTDVIMPEMGGRELADRVRVLRPGLPVLFVSGYTANELGEQGVLGPELAFLQKPFTPEDLAGAVAGALEGARRRERDTVGDRAGEGAGTGSAGGGPAAPAGRGRRAAARTS